MDIFIREACVDSLDQALVAEKKGADRIELCSDLQYDGLTPSENLISEAKKRLNIPVRVMIRPRSGNFVYSEQELLQMEKAIAFCRKVGVDGVVFGILKSDHTLDLNLISRLAVQAFPLKVVIHKAIDDTPDPVKALADLTKLGGIATVLSSGGAKTAQDGRQVLLEMIETSGNIEVMPAGKITAGNVHELHRFLGARAYHGKKIVGVLE